MENCKYGTKSGLAGGRGFSLAELLIVVAIIGILAAIVIPEFQSHSQQAKEAAAKENLRILREAIERYALDHNGVKPGYSGGVELPEGLIEFQLIYYTNLSGDSTGIRTGSYVYGPYLRKIPENPFNHKNTFKKIGVSENFPSSASGTTGWYYKPSTGEIRLNWDGTDSSGVPFLEY